jgi:hypothetical protein
VGIPLKKLKILLWVVASFVALYTLAGFFLVPYFAKDIAKEQLQKRYGLDLNVEKIYFNPYTFFITIQNVRIDEKNTPLLSFASFQANLNPTKYLSGTVEIATLSLEKAIIHPVLESDKTLNFFRIFAPNKTVQEDAQTQNALIFKLDKFDLIDAQVRFEDKSGDTHYTLNFGPLNHTFTGLSTKALANSQHMLAFDLGTYGKLLIDAQMSINPLTVQAKINHDAIHLANSDYLLQKQKFAFAKGGLSYTMDFIFDSNGQSIVKVPQFDMNISDAVLMLEGNKTLESNAATLALRDLTYLLDKSDVTVQTIDASLQENTLYDNFIAKMSHRINDVSLHINGFNLHSAFDANATLVSENTQKLFVNATLDVAKKSYDVQAKAQKIDLTNYNDYIDDYVNIALQQGLLRFDSNATITFENNATAYESKTNVSVEDLSVVNQNNDKLLQTKSIQTQIDAKTNSVSVNNVTVDTMQLYFTNENNQTNFDNLTATSNTQQSLPPTKEKIDFTLKKATLVNGTVFIKDKASFTLQNIEASISDVKEGVSAKAAFKGHLGTHETLSVQATFNPFAPTDFLRLTGEVQSLDLKQISPYAYGTIGREILSGRLSDSFYLNIDASQLDSNHKVVINDLSVSEHLPQSGASPLPINLAIALLQDMNNVINLNLDIKNDLNDPAFKARDVILTVLTNVIIKTASSPFSLLGAIVGLSGDALSEVSFEPASAKLSQESIVTLDALAKVLNERPELSLTLCSAYDAKTDDAALKNATFEALLQTQTIEEIAAMYEVQIIDDTKRLREAIVAAMPTESNALEALANLRAKNVLTYLLEAVSDSKRVSICPQIATQSKDVTFELSAD